MEFEKFWLIFNQMLHTQNIRFHDIFVTISCFILVFLLPEIGTN